MTEAATKLSVSRGAVDRYISVLGPAGMEDIERWKAKGEVEIIETKGDTDVSNTRE